MSAAEETPILDNISSTDDLRKLDIEQLEPLCKELRSDLVNTLSQIGGHFASSLGATEITVALHYVLNTPRDRIVWDTGHQAYIHKILTGRRQELGKVRKLGGISGFPCRSESSFDSFGVAHAGTSISAACGMLEASSMQEEEPRKVAAVIGDGAMTAGMAFEALNHSGQLKRNLIVILNDNEMSIAPNVGALSSAFSKALTGKTSTYARQQFKSLHERGLVPNTVYRALDKAEEATKGFFSTPAMLFESFGFCYIGPVDGHDVNEMVRSLERAAAQDGPVLIHAMTDKGKGYTPAEKDPLKWHAVSPFTPEEGEFKAKPITGKKPPTYTEVFGKTLVELCKENDKLIGVTAAMPDGTGLKFLAEELPDRYFDAGIAEQHAVTFCAGMACEGMKPFCTIYSTFMQRGYDQLVHDVCIQNLPVVFAMDRGGLVGADGPTHHGTFDFAFLRPIPNICIMAPKDEAELKDMMLTAAHYEGPIALRYPRGEGLGVDISQAPKLLEIGKGEVIVEAESFDDSALILAIGKTVSPALEASEGLLGQYGIHSTVVNCRFLKPLDTDLIASLVANHSLIVTVEDGSVKGGLGAEVAEFLSAEGLLDGQKIVRLGVPDKFIEHGTQDELYRICGYDADGICQRVAFELGRPQKNSDKKTPSSQPT